MLLYTKLCLFYYVVIAEGDALVHYYLLATTHFILTQNANEKKSL